MASDELPPGKAFVLQLCQTTGPTLRPFAGRLEHLSSGQRLRFDDLQQFLDALARLLAEANPESSAPEEGDSDG